MTERKYTGILAKRLSIGFMESANKRLHAQYKQDCETRDKALFAAFGVDPSAGDAWRELAFGLAERHVPAYGSFERGRPQVNVGENLDRKSVV